MKIDSVKLDFLLTHWPEIKLQYHFKARLGPVLFPMEYHFYHPHADTLDPDEICMIHITENEFRKTHEAWKYYCL